MGGWIVCGPRTLAFKRTGTHAGNNANFRYAERSVGTRKHPKPPTLACDAAFLRRLSWQIVLELIHVR